DTLSASASVPAASLPAWLSAASLSRLSSSLSWMIKDKAAPADADADARKLFDADPTRSFFSPNEWTLVDTAASVSGTLFKYPATPQSQAAAQKPALVNLDTKAPEDAAGQIDAATAPADPVADALGVMPDLVAPWTETGRQDKAAPADPPGFNAPPLASPETMSERSPFGASLTWNWTPTYSWKRRFLHEAWSEPVDVDWAALYETRTVRNAGTLSLSAGEGLVGLTAGLSASSQFQDRPRVSDDQTYAGDALLATWARQDAQYRNDKVTGTLKLTASPFQDYWLWAPSSLTYSLSSLLYEYAFESMDEGAPTDASRALYETVWADWTDDTVSAHALAFVLGLRPWGYAQSLSITADLPPLLEGYSGALNLKSPWSTLAVSTSYGQAEEDAELLWDPLAVSLSAGTAPWPVLSGTFSWDLEKETPTSLAASVAWNGLSASLSAREAVAYELVLGEGWTSSGDAAFRVSAASVALKSSWKPLPVWRNRVSWTADINASGQQSFLRFTDSYLNVVAGLTCTVHEFLDITFSSTSRNSSLWRYYPGFFSLPEGLDAASFARNPLEDILMSFDFFDETGQARRESLFKLKSLSLEATHHLHDWDLAMKFSSSPVLNEDSLEYTFKTSFSISLAWRSVSQIQTSYTREGEIITWD
ncbi:MAG: hypothetical protein JXM71_11650, partial [Spirochaetales bacterium]|nr:hypothetical protein [Spirochaetales bacterium]